MNGEVAIMPHTDTQTLRQTNMQTYPNFFVGVKRGGTQKCLG